MTAAERRAEIVSDIVARTGIDEAMIARLVHAFYARVRADRLLGPVFAARIDDWDAHLERMCAFWSSVALITGRYQGRPMPAHARLPVDARHFDRWLTLFAETARETCPLAAAAHFVERAETIARSLELGVAVQSGVVLARGERLHRPDGELALPEAAGGAETAGP
ncbi:preprotein translocase subunit TatC [Phormidium willei BDU 130791]|nr:preprotein translocase subunit TatC [Phormidium willei BDU 130791]